MGTSADPWSDTPAETPEEDEVRWCAAIVVPGQMYLRNGDPGYPDEGCDEEALPGSKFCATHQGYDDDRDEIDYGDPDMEYDVLRERMGE